jgi:hypothetical protein|tara:strand:+ start:433 stop:678 length:246 start_codon:yes stop_codon:yes gene_type:complete
MKRAMTKAFPAESELIRFMIIHLSDLYDSYTEAEQEDNGSIMDYVQGSIDSTQVYLSKSGMQYMEYEDYLEIANAEWKVAR